jgi:hypothetical protein
VAALHAKLSARKIGLLALGAESCDISGTVRTVASTATVDDGSGLSIAGCALDELHVGLQTIFGVVFSDHIDE